MRRIHAPGYELWRSDRYWECGCGNSVVRGEEYAVRLRDNEELCMECHNEITVEDRRKL